MFLKTSFVVIFAAIAVVLCLPGLSLACPGPVTSFSGKHVIRDGTSGAILRDQLPSSDNDDKVWYLPTHTGNTIEEYRTMDDFVAGTVLTTYRLPGHAGSGGMTGWGQGRVVYNNSLYYQRFPDCLSYSYDCDNEKAILVRYDFNLRAFTALQSLPTVHLSHWAAGPTYVYLAIDGGSVWAIGLNKDRALHLTKLNARDLSIEDTINTDYTRPASNNMPPFIICGKLYNAVPAGQFVSRVDYVLDLSTKQADVSTQALYCLAPYGRQYFSFDSRENKVYTLDNSNLVSYDVTIGGSYETNAAMLNCVP